MSEPWNEDDGILREWAPLSKLLQEIPHTARRGIFLENVSLTCVDIIPEYIAVGTNIGVVYWYHRETHNLERLRPEKSGSSISCVKIVSTVDFMVAVGDKGGTVTIFRIPKPTSPFLPSNYKLTSNHQVERYTVGGLHTAPVTALEWSVNGQNLFSGDLLGLVVYTEIDFYMNLSKASEILNEKYCIVQLSFNHHCHILLVATEYRCILVHKNESWRVVQIGQKERRSLCHIGATFVHRPKQPLEPLVYSGRTGLRFWHADKQGVVHKTIIFKDAVRKTHPTIRLLKPPLVNTFVYDGDLGPLLVWKSCLLVTYNSSSLLILDPENTSVVASITGLNNLHSVAVSQDEIFIIVGSRNIMRLAYTPDNFRAEDKDLPMAFLELKVAPVADTLMDLSLKLKETASKFVNTQPSNAVNGMVGDQEIVSTAAEALELDLPPILSLESNAIEELTIQQDPKIQILDQIGKQSFEDIIYSTGKKVIKTNKRNLKTKNVSSLSISSELHSDSTNKKKVCNSSSSFSDNEHLLRASGDIPHMSLPQMKPDLNISNRELTSLVIPAGIYPDLRSPDTILKDLQDKEFLVAREFHLEDILLNINEEKLISDNYNDEGTFVAPESDIKSNPVINDYKLLPEKVGVKDTSNVPTTDVISCHSYPEHPLIQEYFQQDDILEENVGWNKVACPEIALTLAVSNDYICITGPGMSVHYGVLGENSIVWQKLSYKANELKMSPSADLVWKLDFGVASALTDEIMGLIGCKWELAARCVESVSLGQSVAWYVSGGKVYLQKGLNKTKPFTDSIPISCPIQVTKISCMEMMVLVLTLEHSIMWRCGITDECEEGTHWRSVNIPSSIQGEDIALGPKNTAWILDKSNRLYFSHNYTNDYSEWWQVKISNYTFENTSLCQLGSNSFSIWITNKMSQFIFMNSSIIKGDRWSFAPITGINKSTRWRQITAEGVFEDNGSLWLLSTTAELYHTMPDSYVLKSVVLPCHGEDVVILAAAPHTLWILTQLGHIYIRQGVGKTSPDGTKWRKLNLEQISTEVTFRHISCGSDVIWACDTKGDVYMVVGSPYEIATDIFSPAWVAVEGKPQPDTVFNKVFVSSETHMVWALDNKNNIYVREGIFPDFQLGTGWVVVSGVQALTLSVSGSAVWALSLDGSVFCRHGISQNNYIGNYWVQIFGSLSTLSASLSDDIWGVCDGALVSYSNKTINLKETSTVESDGNYKKMTDDWEIVFKA